jgi:hypothetical protein
MYLGLINTKVLANATISACLAEPTTSQTPVTNRDQEWDFAISIEATQ